MLKIVRCMKELDFSALMEIYIEGNRENGADHYPNEPRERQLLLAEQDFYEYLRESFFGPADAFYAVWLRDGKYMSALRMEPYRDGLLLTALETAPAYRRQGFAAALIGATLATLKGRKVYSHVHKGNTASLRVHEKCGFRRILEHAVYLDGSVLQSSCTFCYET